MPVDERSRHRLYRKLEEILGSEEAGTLMDHLPPAGLSSLATKDNVLMVRNDLTAARNELTGRMDSLEHRLTARMEQLARRLVMWMSSMVLASAALAFAAGRFV